MTLPERVLRTVRTHGLVGAGHAALTDACPLDDPFVGGIDDLALPSAKKALDQAGVAAGSLSCGAFAMRTIIRKSLS